MNSHNERIKLLNENSPDLYIVWRNNGGGVADSRTGLCEGGVAGLQYGFRIVEA